MLCTSTTICNRQYKPYLKERQQYIEVAKQHKFRIIGYYFHTDVAAAITCNARRNDKELIPLPGIRGTYKKLVQPSYDEGFDKIYRVEITEYGFRVAPIPEVKP